ncbi:hypothetical protein SAMN02745857_00771 [Andreprevotia lacus DSM 23236]|jgi:hypothetical protein|uniref:DUF4280 domain-containing protein n=1 Tax=Andreprevotia lacus DSM 23236 TaxID=1121001 RepID=A0A1W1X785_9NEIS|nr:hypothetical protein [Andreprevotia lacus]SMC19700.1 hypothetical protein SAMN02745857_00771 [Andreprevotia lacus DSM 23236]
MAALLTTASSLQCPHGGTVSIVSANTSAKADAALALANDTFTISGCPFQIPVGTGSVPSPCVKVQWVVTNLQTKVNGTPTLSQSSAGICLAATQAPQGPVSIVQTQPKVSGT